MKHSLSDMEKCDRSESKDIQESTCADDIVRLESDVFDSDKSSPKAEVEDFINSKPGTVSMSCLSEKSSPKLVKHCGPDCTMSQRIVDKLLSRMSKLENERSELLAANRSWGVQYKLMKENYLNQIEALKDKVQHLEKEKHDRGNGQNERRQTRSFSSLSNPNSQQDRLDVLTHQAQVYKEDFLEERKARTRAHSQIEALRCELKRERKSRSKLAALVQQSQLSCEKPAAVISASN